MAQCQCLRNCKRRSIKGSAFCSYHQQGCARVSPLSGAEPAYAPDSYNGLADQQSNHNCYAYAFDINEDLKAACEAKAQQTQAQQTQAQQTQAQQTQAQQTQAQQTQAQQTQAQQTQAQQTGEGCSLRFHQPGYSAGFKRFGTVNKLQCPDILARILSDVPTAKVTDFQSKCPVGTSKIALVIDDKRDYHFYRQDRGGMWSHKPGSGKVTNKDAAGNRIYDPALAARNYSKGVKSKDNSLDYKYFCSYMCVPRGDAKRTFRMKRGGRRSHRTEGKRSRRTFGRTHKSSKGRSAPKRTMKRK
jgi:hypothetical protein